MLKDHAAIFEPRLEIGPGSEVPDRCLSLPAILNKCEWDALSSRRRHGFRRKGRKHGRNLEKENREKERNRFPHTILIGSIARKLYWSSDERQDVFSGSFPVSKIAMDWAILPPKGFPRNGAITMNDALPTSVSIGDSALYQELEDEVVLLNMSNQQYYGLNDVGAQMWKSLMETGNVAAAGDRLAEMYEVEPGVLHADLEKLVRDLLDAGLLKAA